MKLELAAALKLALVIVAEFAFSFAVIIAWFYVLARIFG